MGSLDPEVRRRFPQAVSEDMTSTKLQIQTPGTLARGNP